MDGMTAILAHAGLESSGSVCSTGSVARLCTGFGPGDIQSSGALDQPSEFLQMLQEVSETATDSELEASNRAQPLTGEADAELQRTNRLKSAAAHGKDGPQPDSEASEAAGGKMPDEDELDGGAPVLVDTASSQAHPEAAALQASAMLAATPTLAPDSAAASQESACPDESSSGAYIAPMPSGGSRHGEGGFSVDSSAWRHVETAQASTAQTQTGAGGVRRIGGQSYTRLAQGRRGVEALPGNKGAANVRAQAVLIAPEADESNTPVGLRLLGERVHAVGFEHADSKGGLWNTMPVLGDGVLSDSVESALFISGALRTNDPGAQGLAVQMETAGREMKDGGPSKVLQNAGMWANWGFDLSSTERNAETGTANQAVGAGRQAAQATGSVKPSTPLLIRGTGARADGDRILNPVAAPDGTFPGAPGEGGVVMDVPDPTGMEEAEQHKEAAREMPEDVSLLARAEASDGGIPGVLNAHKSSSGSYANSMADGDYDYASRLIGVEDTGLSDGLPSPGALSAEGHGREEAGLSAIGTDKARFSDAEVGGIDDIADGVGVDIVESTPGPSERASGAVGFELEAEAVESGVRSGADRVNKLGLGEMRTEAPELQADAHGILREEERPASWGAAPRIQNEDGHVGETDTDHAITTTGYGPRDASDRESETREFGLQETQDPGRMRVDFDGLRKDPGKIERGKVPTERMPSDEGESFFQEVAPGTRVENGPTGEAGPGRGAATADHAHGLEAARGRMGHDARSGSDARSDGQSYAGHEAALERESEPSQSGSRRAEGLDGVKIAQSGLRASPGEMPVGTGPTDGTPPADAKALTNEAGRSVMQQIAAHIEARRNSRSGEFRAKLVPGSLGEVQIRIRVQGRACTATIRVGNSEVGDYIEKHGADLKALLSESGIDLADLSVSVGSHSSSRDAGGQAQAQYAAAAFADGGRRGRREYGLDKPWLDDTQPQDVIAAREIPRAAVSMRPGYGRIDYFA